jgi:hypothetical protein
MLGTLETSKTLFYATLGMLLAPALSTLFASQFLCAHLPVLKSGGKRAHRPYSLCSRPSTKNMKNSLFMGRKEANLRTKQCGKNVFQLDLNVSSLCEKHDLNVLKHD